MLIDAKLIIKNGNKSTIVNFNPAKLIIKNGNKSTIVNFNPTLFYRIHGRIVVNASVKLRKQIFIGVGDIHRDRQHLKYLVNLSKQNGTF